MSVKPDDIDQDAWDAARHALSYGFEIRIESHGHAARVARAIMAAKEEEREACALLSEKYKHHPNGYSPEEPDKSVYGWGRARREIAGAIRNRSNPA